MAKGKGKSAVRSGHKSGGKSGTTAEGKSGRNGVISAELREFLRAGEGMDLTEISTDGTPGFNGGKRAGTEALAAGARTLSNLQEMFFAGSRFGDDRKVLLILQGMDTAGKGGVVRHVVGAVNPQGVHHVAFAAPTKEELGHDFLWRIRRHLPEAGMIAVFDRSHYEDVLVGRVRELAPAEEIEKRYELINRFEQSAVDHGTTVIKVMLHISPKEQKRRLADRLDRPDKHWKYDPADVDERMRWADYQAAYEAAIQRTSTEAAPWFIVPADRKWFARLAVQHLLVDALQRMDLAWPAATFDAEAEKARLAAS
ncbi:MAG: phosphate--nucleotide phosphotransferase [Cryobacterium sp.]|nr:phosphate--nucleotide phosphotransferase [Cryobacterium sp.]